MPAGKIYSTGQTALVNSGPKKGLLVAVLAHKVKSNRFIVGPVRGGDTFEVDGADLIPTNDGGGSRA